MLTGGVLIPTGLLIGYRIGEAVGGIFDFRYGTGFLPAIGGILGAIGGDFATEFLPEILDFSRRCGRRWCEGLINEAGQTSTILP